MALGLGLGIQNENKVSEAGFSLTDISGLASWYPFNTGHNLDGVNLVSWLDASGNNNTLFNISATNKRPTVSNGEVDWGHTPGVFMDATSHTPGSNEFTCFFVLDVDVVYSTTQFSRLATNTSSSPRTDLLLWGTLSNSATGQLWQFYGNTFQDSTYRISTFTSAGVIVDETKTIVQYTRSGTNFKVETYQNGASKTLALSTTLSNTSSTFEINRFGDTTQEIDGKMNEMAFFNRGLTSDEIDKVIVDIKARNSMT